MTILIPDSWELPSYLAGDVTPMDRYRDRERATVPDDEWTPGQKAKVFDIGRKKQRSLPPESDFEPPQSAWSSSPFWGRERKEPEVYDPEQWHDPAELYSQDSLDSLEGSGFYPHEPGVWHRPVADETGEELGDRHILVHNPGHRRPSDNSRAPWQLMTDPEQVGEAFSALRGPGGAISAADAEREQMRKMPKHARLYLVDGWRNWDRHGE